MKQVLAVAVLFVAAACNGGLSKSDARDLVKTHYSKKEIVGSLNLGLVSILLPAGELERDPLTLFNKYCNEAAVKAAIAKGLVSVTFEESKVNDYYNQLDVRYRLALTEKGRPFEREHDRGTMRQVYWLKVADYLVGDVTGVVTKGNESKIYYTTSFSGTPFADIATPMNVDIKMRNQPMTAMAIFDGKTWHVQRVLEGTR
jgi:hypothetical protein